MLVAVEAGGSEVFHAVFSAVHFCFFVFYCRLRFALHSEGSAAIDTFSALSRCEAGKKASFILAVQSHLKPIVTP